MDAIPRDRWLQDIVSALQRLNGPATVEEIQAEVSRSGGFQFPEPTRTRVISMLLNQNRDGHGMGVFVRRPEGTFRLSSAETRSRLRATPTLPELGGPI